MASRSVVRLVTKNYRNNSRRKRLFLETAYVPKNSLEEKENIAALFMDVLSQKLKPHAEVLPGFALLPKDYKMTFSYATQALKPELLSYSDARLSYEGI